MADAPINWGDPCARAAALSTAYYLLISGQSEAEIRTRTLDQEELVRFQRADLNRLQAEMLAAQRECAVATGQPVPMTRHAIGLGYRPRGPVRGY